ncbi:hypothetical protein DERF_010191 [Dermatophagoides farinae]|uniref:Uncharacterized protein n=1 Tax=Dermatophagoides farinae TaxID=6954 RepID=A0A922HXW7_DERFA|nr:hypothetical protein DERF_010191 [Dermatophagoides farinae]
MSTNLSILYMMMMMMIVIIIFFDIFIHCQTIACCAQQNSLTLAIQKMLPQLN